MSIKTPSEYDISRGITRVANEAWKYGWDCGRGISESSDKNLRRMRRRLRQIVKRVLESERKW